MLGLAQLAAQWAAHRTVGINMLAHGFILDSVGTVLLARRDYPGYKKELFPLSADYYRICDEVTAGKRTRYPTFYIHWNGASPVCDVIDGPEFRSIDGDLWGRQWTPTYAANLNEARRIGARLFGLSELHIGEP